MIVRLDGTPPQMPFPSPNRAETDPDGLVAVGGDLTPTRLINAYRCGIFPWYSAGQPLLWWSPDPRMVLFPSKLHVSRSLRKVLRKGYFRVTFDRAFDAVIQGCAQPRRDQGGSWLTPEMIQAYGRLHRLGVAHSVECWQGETLVGGLYGVQLGRIFFGESMFHRVTDASKVAFVELTRTLEARGCPLIDCQVHSDHLASLGAELVPRPRFLEILEEHVEAPFSFPEAPCSDWA